MSYRSLGSGYADTMSEYYKSEALASLRAQNEKVADGAVKKLDISAKYAGPLRRAEAEAFEKLMDSGAAGQMPTPAQFAPIAQNLASGVAAVAATAGCAPAGPAAPLCGAMAGFVADKMAEAILGTSSTGCPIKVNGLCYEDWIRRVYERQLALCPPGDSGCRNKVKAVQDNWTKGFQANWLKWSNWQASCSKYQDSFGPFANASPPLDCYSQCKDPYGKVSASCVLKEASAGRGPAAPPLNTTDLRVLDQTVMAEVMKAKYQAEYNFVKTVDQQSALILKTVIPQCSGSGCVKQVRGILNEGIFEASQELRTGGTEFTARKIMRSAVDQADGVIAQSKRVADLEATRKAGGHQGISSDTKTKADMMSARNESRKKALVVAGILAAGAVAFAFYRRRS